MSTVDIRPDHAKIVQDILQKFVPDNAVWVFGSRAKWLAKEHSDLDLCIMGDTPLPFITLGLLEEAFEDSDLPYKVDVVDWATTSPEFKKIIARDKIVLKTEKNKKMDKSLKQGWIETTLGAVCDKIGDGIHGTPKYCAYGKYYFINGNNLQNGYVVIKNNTNTVDEEEFQKYKKNLNENTILLSINGTIGNLAKYRNEFCILGKSAAYLNINKNIKIDFIYYLLLDKSFQNEILSNANGSTIKNVSLAQLREYPLLLPPLPEQQAIAEILSSLDDKIAINAGINKTLETMAQAIFKSWFVDFDPVYAKKNVLEGGGTSEQANLAAMSVISGKSDAELEELETSNPQAYNELAHTASLFPSDFEESELGWIPVGWVVKPLGDVVTPKKGKNITKKTITIGNIPVVAGGLEPAYYHNQSNVSAPVVTISASGANAGFINLYYIDIWASDCSYVNNTQTNFVYTIYSLLKIRQSEIFGMQQGAAQPHIYPSDIMRIIITDAPKDIWKKCENTISLFYKMIGSNIQHSQTLSQIRDSLLPKLLSGEIDVGGVKEEIL